MLFPVVFAVSVLVLAVHSSHPDAAKEGSWWKVIVDKQDQTPASDNVVACREIISRFTLELLQDATIAADPQRIKCRIDSVNADLLNVRVQIDEYTTHIQPWWNDGYSKDGVIGKRLWLMRKIDFGQHCHVVVVQKASPSSTPDPSPHGSPIQPKTVGAVSVAGAGCDAGAPVVSVPVTPYSSNTLAVNRKRVCRRLDFDADVSMLVSFGTPTMLVSVGTPKGNVKDNDGDQFLRDAQPPTPNGYYVPSEVLESIFSRVPLSVQLLCKWCAYRYSLMSMTKSKNVQLWSALPKRVIAYYMPSVMIAETVRHGFENGRVNILSDLHDHSVTSCAQLIITRSLLLSSPQTAHFDVGIVEYIKNVVNNAETTLRMYLMAALLPDKVEWVKERVNGFEPHEKRQFVNYLRHTQILIVKVLTDKSQVMSESHRGMLERIVAFNNTWEN